MKLYEKKDNKPLPVSPVIRTTGFSLITSTITCSSARIGNFLLDSCISGVRSNLTNVAGFFSILTIGCSGVFFDKPAGLRFKRVSSFDLLRVLPSLFVSAREASFALSGVKIFFSSFSTGQFSISGASSFPSFSIDSFPLSLDSCIK